MQSYSTALARTAARTARQLLVAMVPNLLVRRSTGVGNCSTQQLLAAAVAALNCDTYPARLLDCADCARVWTNEMTIRSHAGAQI
jgi:hypothetical protein